MNPYQLNQQVTMNYINPPVSQSDQYGLGKPIEIRDSETNELLASFIVLETNEYTVSGVICSINNSNNLPVFI